MADRIGLLLPRSTDYPSLGFDVLDALKAYFAVQKIDAQFIAENIGYGEDQSLNYAKAEKLILQDDVNLVVAYCNTNNAEPLYALSEATGKPFIFLDAGMQLPQEKPHAACFHISLQGMHGCRVAGYLAGADTRKVLMATSFYDGGYRGPWGYTRGLEEAGGSVCGNFVSAYRIADFNIDNYLSLLQQTEAQSVAACFSSYLADLFIKSLKEKGPEAVSLPFYCSPFMAEEQMLAKCDFPGGRFYAVVPWATSLQNEEQSVFTEAIRNKNGKPANIFHLLGWEAGILIEQINNKGITSLGGAAYQSPRGEVVIHPTTHYTYAPFYKGVIVADAAGKCSLTVEEQLEVTAADHERVMNDHPDSVVSGWRNNYLCI